MVVLYGSDLTIILVTHGCFTCHIYDNLDQHN